MSISRRAAWSLFCAMAVILDAAHASCDNRPGTPDQVRAVPLSPSKIQFIWRNTTGHHLLEPEMYFDIYLRQNGVNIGRDLTGDAHQSGLQYHDESNYFFNGLQPNTNYCMSLRARTEGGTEGCVSGLASAEACAMTLAPGSPERAPDTLTHGDRQLPQPPASNNPSPSTNVCSRTAYLDVTTCKNIDGSAAQYMTPLHNQACGRDEKDAENAAKKVMSATATCLGDEPGCCQYTVHFAGGVCACTFPQGIGTSSSALSTRSEATWSAFAASPNGHWGYAVKQTGFVAASQLAEQGCGGKAQGCKVFATTQAVCTAFADSRQGGYWFAAGAALDAKAAQANALRFCQSGSAPPASCKVQGTWCR